VLPAATERIWGFLSEQPALSGFVLIGGTALAIHLRHRRSEDLDLVYPAGICLPVDRLEVLLRAAAHARLDFQPDDDEAAVQEFAFAGMDLHEYQQNFLVDSTVKVSFFVPDAALAKVLDAPFQNKVRIATLQQLFKTKCLVAARRSKTRDWLDLYVLLREHGFSMRDFQKAFVEVGVPSQCDIALSRLCSGIPQRDDEGYTHLLANPPPLSEIKAYFIEQRNLMEIDSAADKLRDHKSGDPQQSPEAN